MKIVICSQTKPLLRKYAPIGLDYPRISKRTCSKSELRSRSSTTRKKNKHKMRKGYLRNHRRIIVSRPTTLLILIKCEVLLTLVWATPKSEWTNKKPSVNLSCDLSSTNNTSHYHYRKYSRPFYVITLTEHWQLLYFIKYVCAVTRIC